MDGVRLFGKTLTRRELEARVGHLGQIAGFRGAQLEDGTARGVRVLDVYNAAGLRFTLCPDRNMDVVGVTWRGIPLAWESGAGLVHPAFGANDTGGVIRRMHGGLMFTGGLENVGRAGRDGEVVLPLHGSISSQPVNRFGSDVRWDEDRAVLHVWSESSTARLFGDRLDLRRTISCPADLPEIDIVDVVRNSGFTAAPCQILYHVNFGFPIVAEETRVEAALEESTPADAFSASARDQAMCGGPPVPGMAAHEFWHRVQPDAAGEARVRILNPLLGIGVELRYRAAELPVLWQWKFLRAGQYVIALEPSTTLLQGRAKARESGQLRTLQPGEQWSLHLNFRFLGPDDLSDKP